MPPKKTTFRSAPLGSTRTGAHQQFPRKQTRATAGANQYVGSCCSPSQLILQRYLIVFFRYKWPRQRLWVHLRIPLPSGNVGWTWTCIDNNDHAPAAPTLTGRQDPSDAEIFNIVYSKYCDDNLSSENETVQISNGNDLGAELLHVPSMSRATSSTNTSKPIFRWMWDSSFPNGICIYIY